MPDELHRADAGLTSLLQRAPLLPGESLPSLVGRLADLNFYDSDNVIHGLCRQADRPVRFRGDAGYTGPEELRALSPLTGIALADLHRASEHAFAPVLAALAQAEATDDWGEPYPFPVLGRTRVLARQLRSHDHAQFCPACLGNGRYHRRLWLATAVAACLEHCNLLVDECPECRAHFGIPDLLRGQCRGCGLSLSAAPVESVAGDAAGLLSQAVLQNWLTGAASDVGARLPGAEPPTLCHVINGLIFFIISQRAAWQRLAPPLEGLAEHIQQPVRGQSRLSPRSAYYLYRAAVGCLAEWPVNFYRMLESVRSCHGTAPPLGGLAQFGTLFSHWIARRWRGPEFEFVRQAFSEYLWATPNPIASLNHDRQSVRRFLRNPPHLDKRGAMRALGISGRTMSRLLAGGHLDLCVLYRNGGRVYVFDREQIRLLREAWNDGLLLDEAAECLGVSRSVTLRLAEEQAIRPLRGPAVDGSAEWLFKRTTVRGFFHQVNRRAQTARQALPALLTLPQAAQRLGNLGLDCARVLIEVAGGNLRAFRPETAWELRHLRLTKADVRTFHRRYRERQCWLTLAEAAARIGVKRVVLTRWLRRGLLKPVASYGSALYFDESAIRSFRAEHVFSDEAAQILGLERLAVQKWARAGRLKPVSGPRIDGCHRYLFRRADLEPLRPTQRLTAPQMAEQLGLSRSQVNVRIRHGTLKPVSGPGIDGSGHYLFSTREPHLGNAGPGAPGRRPGNSDQPRLRNAEAPDPNPQLSPNGNQPTTSKRYRPE